MWFEVTVRVRVSCECFSVCGTAVFAKQVCHSIGGEAVLIIHVEVVLVEGENELPFGVVCILGNGVPGLIVAFGQLIDIIPKLFPSRPGCISRLSLFCDVAVGYKPRLDVAALNEQRAPL